MTELTTLEALEALTAKEEAGATLTGAECDARRALRGVAEAAYPEASAALDAWLETDDDDRLPGRVILDAVKS
jgi:hypothetical protein